MIWVQVCLVEAARHFCPGRFQKGMPYFCGTEEIMGLHLRGKPAGQSLFLEQRNALRLQNQSQLPGWILNITYSQLFKRVLGLQPISLKDCSTFNRVFSLISLFWYKIVAWLPTQFQWKQLTLAGFLSPASEPAKCIYTTRSWDGTEHFSSNYFTVLGLLTNCLRDAYTKKFDGIIIKEQFC